MYVFKNVFTLYRVSNFSVYCGIVIRVESFCSKREKHVFSRIFCVFVIGKFCRWFWKVFNGRGIEGREGEFWPCGRPHIQKQIYFHHHKQLFSNIFLASNYYAAYMLKLLLHLTFNSIIDTEGTIALHESCLG